MGIAYKELFRVNRPICGPGPGGFFIKRFKEGGYSEAELLDLFSGVDFSLGEVDEDISLKKKCEIVEQAVSGVHYTSWAPSVISMIISLTVGGCLSAWAGNNSIAAGVFVTPCLIALGIYAWFRLCFERNQTVLLGALNHIKTLQP